jgi:nucleoside 2-deoxyribosyltransferase
MKIYIAGPMRGYKDYNFPAFHEAARHLRAKGHEVVNPAEMDEAAFQTQEEIDKQAKAEGSTKMFMARDLPAMLGCDAVLLLSGWGQSQGACTEAFTAAMSGMPVYDNERLSDALSIYRLYVIIGEKITS